VEACATLAALLSSAVWFENDHMLSTAAAACAAAGLPTKLLAILSAREAEPKLLRQYAAECLLALCQGGSTRSLRAAGAASALLTLLPPVGDGEPAALSGDEGWVVSERAGVAALAALRLLLPCPPPPRAVADERELWACDGLLLPCLLRVLRRAARCHEADRGFHPLSAMCDEYDDMPSASATGTSSFEGAVNSSPPLQAVKLLRLLPPARAADAVRAGVADALLALLAVNQEHSDNGGLTAVPEAALLTLSRLAGNANAQAALAAAGGRTAQLVFGLRGWTAHSTLRCADEGCIAFGSLAFCSACGGLGHQCDNQSDWEPCATCGAAICETCQYRGEEGEDEDVDETFCAACGAAKTERDKAAMAAAQAAAGQGAAVGGADEPMAEARAAPVGQTSDPDDSEDFA
jgi:hypothetical protein